MNPFDKPFNNWTITDFEQALIITRQIKPTKTVTVKEKDILEFKSCEPPRFAKCIFNGDNNTMTVGKIYELDINGHFITEKGHLSLRKFNEYRKNEWVLELINKPRFIKCTKSPRMISDLTVGKIYELDDNGHFIFDTGYLSAYRFDEYEEDGIGFEIVTLEREEPKITKPKVVKDNKQTRKKAFQAELEKFIHTPGRFKTKVATTGQIRKELYKLPKTHPVNTTYKSFLEKCESKQSLVHRTKNGWGRHYRSLTEYDRLPKHMRSIKGYEEVFHYKTKCGTKYYKHLINL